jgi:hypothetical protein
LLRRGNNGIREFIQKAFKEIVEWLEKKLGVKLDVLFTKSMSIKNLQKLYGKNFAKVGAKSTLKKYNDELAILVRNAESASQKALFKKAFKKSKKKLSEEAYVAARVRLIVKNKKGLMFEDLFQKIHGGVKLKKPIITPFTKRFMDNLKSNKMCELKSGFVSNQKNALTLPPNQLDGFAKQVVKDMEILRTSLTINKLEYHIIDGISDEAAEFIHVLAKQYNKLENVMIVLYK